MHALVLEQPGRLAAARVEPPEAPPAGMALVRVRRVGVCGTDFHAWRGRQPFFTFPRILGHELAVEVVELGSQETAVRKGDRCAVEPYLHCGECGACLRGRANCCERLRVMGVHVDGGMRELLHVPLDKLHPSATLDLETLALVETLSVGAHAVDRGAPVAGDGVLVVGAGPIGLSVAAFALERGATVAVADVSDSRLSFCRQALPDATALSGSGDGMADAVRAAFGGTAPLLVFDATGHRESMGRAVTLAAHGGTVVYVGLVQGDVSFADPEFHRRELTLKGSRNALPADFRRVIAALESGSVDVHPWITHRASLLDVPDQFPGWTDPAAGVVKALVTL